MKGSAIINGKIKMTLNYERHLPGGVIRGCVLCAHGVFNFGMNVQSV